jgi:lipoprotein signal peptidase
MQASVSSMGPVFNIADSLIFQGVQKVHYRS